MVRTGTNNITSTSFSALSTSLSALITLSKLAINSNSAYPYPYPGGQNLNNPCAPNKKVPVLSSAIVTVGVFFKLAKDLFPHLTQRVYVLRVTPTNEKEEEAVECQGHAPTL